MRTIKQETNAALEDILTNWQREDFMDYERAHVNKHPDSVKDLTRAYSNDDFCYLPEEFREQIARLGNARKAICQVVVWNKLGNIMKERHETPKDARQFGLWQKQWLKEKGLDSEYVIEPLRTRQYRLDYYWRTHTKV